MCKIGDVVKIEIFPEICCEICNDVIHNHMTCIVCKDDYAPTSEYSSLIGTICGEANKISCENCGTIYKFVDEPSYETRYDENVKVEIIKLGEV